MCMAVFGIGMLFNHRNHEKVTHHWDAYSVNPVSDNYWTPSSVMTPVAYSSTVPVKRGEELYISYGTYSVYRRTNVTASPVPTHVSAMPTVSSTLPICLNLSQSVSIRL